MAKSAREEPTLDLLYTEAPCLFITVTWGESTLSACQLSPPRAYYVGESREMLDVLVPDVRRTALVEVAADGAVALALIPGMRGVITPPEAAPESFEIEPRAARRCVDFPLGAEALFVLGGLTFHVEHGSAPVVKRHAALAARSTSASLLASIGLHVAALAISARCFMSVMDPAASSIDLDRPAIAVLSPIVTITSSKEEVEEPRPLLESSADGDASMKMRCGESHGGGMGDPDAIAREGRYGIAGPPDNPDPHVARFDNEPPIISLFPLPFGLMTPWRGAQAPVAPWGRDDELGNDGRTARAQMFGAKLQRSFGMAGIGAGPLRSCATCGSLGGGGVEAHATLAAGATRTEAATQIARTSEPIAMCKEPLIEAPLTRVVLK